MHRSVGILLVYYVRHIDPQGHGISCYSVLMRVALRIFLSLTGAATIQYLRTTLIDWSDDYYIGRVKTSLVPSLEEPEGWMRVTGWKVPLRRQCRK